MNRLLDAVDVSYMECEKDFENFGERLKYIARFYMSWNCASPLTDNMRIAIVEKKVLQAVFPARWAVLSPQFRHLLSFPLA